METPQHAVITVHSACHVSEGQSTIAKASHTTNLTTSSAHSNLLSPSCLRVRFYGRRQSKQKFAARSVSPSSTSTNLGSAFGASAKMVRISVLGGECGLEQQRRRGWFWGLERLWELLVACYRSYEALTLCFSRHGTNLPSLPWPSFVLARCCGMTVNRQTEHGFGARSVDCRSLSWHSSNCSRAPLLLPGSSSSRNWSIGL